MVIWGSGTEVSASFVAQAARGSLRLVVIKRLSLATPPCSSWAQGACSGARRCHLLLCDLDHYLMSLSHHFICERVTSIYQQRTCSRSEVNWRHVAQQLSQCRHKHHHDR